MFPRLPLLVFCATTSLPKHFNLAGMAHCRHEAAAITGLPECLHIYPRFVGPPFLENATQAITDSPRKARIEKHFFFFLRSRQCHATPPKPCILGFFSPENATSAHLSPEAAFFRELHSLSHIIFREPWSALRFGASLKHGGSLKCCRAFLLVTGSCRL